MINQAIYLFAKIDPGIEDRPRPHTVEDMRISKEFSDSVPESVRVRAVYEFRNDDGRGYPRWYLSQEEIEYIYGVDYVDFVSKQGLYPFITVYEYRGRLETSFGASFEPPSKTRSPISTIGDFVQDNYGFFITGIAELFFSQTKIDNPIKMESSAGRDASEVINKQKTVDYARIADPISAIKNKNTLSDDLKIIPQMLIGAFIGYIVLNY